MLEVLIIPLVTVFFLIIAVIFFPEIKVKNIKLESFWIVSLIGAIFLVIFGYININEIFSGITNNSSINPLKILAIFISMTLLSIILDELGFFKRLAYVALSKANGKQTKMFIYLYITVSILTIFTSNDIIILTFTPFICYFSKNAKINPLPYLISEFVAANTWSMMLIIGNPTNIYLASSYQIGFFEYFKVMVLPTVFSASFAFLILYLLFRKSLSKKLDIVNIDDGFYQLNNKTLVNITLIHLALCTVLLSVSSYIGFEMYLICIIFALSAIISILIYKLFSKKDKVKVLYNSFKKLPWTLVPFILSMFVFVLTLNKYEITKEIANLISNFNQLYGYGILSFLSANIINNIPMSVLFSDIIMNINKSADSAIYATIIGSNIGAYLTPIGALAGIMWLKILKKEKINLSFTKFSTYGFVLSFPTIIIALVTLSFVL